MKIVPLKNCAVEILDCDLENLTERDYAELKEIYLNELIIVFKNQPRKTVPYMKLIYSFSKGDIANWGQCQWNIHGNLLSNKPKDPVDPFTYQGEDDLYPVQRVTGQIKNGKRSGIFGTGKLDWHSNYNGPGRASCVGLHGVSEAIKGTSTSFMDTTKAYAAMPEDLKKRCEGVVGEFMYAPEIWAEGLPEDQYNFMKGNIQPYSMPLINESSRGKKGLYFHYNNKCHFPSDPGLLEALKDHCFKEDFVYTHYWEPGDAIIMDQILTLHKRDQDQQEILDERVLIRSTLHVKDN